jgi:hypothetical protein
MIGLLIGAAIMAYQIKYGLITAAQTQAAQWSLLKPYGWTLGGYLILHSLLTAWRLDREAEQALGLRLVVFPAFTMGTGQVLRLRVENHGPSDKFALEVWALGGAMMQAHGFPMMSRWEDGNGGAYVDIPHNGTHFVDVLEIPFHLNKDEQIPRIGSLRMFRPQGEASFHIPGHNHADIELRARVIRESDQTYRNLDYRVVLDAHDGHNIRAQIFREPLMYYGAG